MSISPHQLRGAMAVTALASAFALLAWLPQYRQAARLREQITAAQKQLELNRQGAVGLAALSGDVAQLEQRLQNSSKTLPSPERHADMLTQLSRYLESRQLTKAEVQSRPVMPGVECSVLPMELRFEGTFPAVFGLMRDLESDSRILRVSNLRLEGRASADPARLLTVRVELSAFFGPQESRP